MSAPSWAAERLGARLIDDATSDTALADLVEVAIRRNPRRAQLLVSTVLGKHIPADPRSVLAAGSRLGTRVRTTLDGALPALVLGYAETATALGHCVARTLGARYVHSTRRIVPGVVPTGTFEEEHSHSTGHRLLPDDPALLGLPGVVVLVDDEVSTGRTALNTVEMLQSVLRRDRYVLACLVDLRTAADRAALATAGAALGARIDVVRLGSGHLEYPPDFGVAAAGIAARVVEPAPRSAATHLDSIATWPREVRDGGRHGFTPSDDERARAAAAGCASSIVAEVIGSRVLVLGSEELMYAPLLVASELQSMLGPSHTVRFSSTTRSPVVAIDEPGYPIRTRLVFPSHDDPADGPGDRFAYNVAPAATEPGFSDVVVVVDDVADTAALHRSDGLLAQVAAACERVHLLVVPSYRPVPALAVTP
ncbi:MAG: hypothetical protein QOG80_2140 [Pseudonocardiales bacterium]|nr:hypothetical protein [Pseudonocardiales bacterium]